MISPSNSKAKMELNTEETKNPIMQDTIINQETKEKELRFYAKLPLFNYGLLPQTWEDSSQIDQIIGLPVEFNIKVREIMILLMFVNWEASRFVR